MKNKLPLVLAFCLTFFIITLSSCKKKAVKGCMDPNSLTYNAKATVDDGSCTYPPKAVGQNFGGGIIAYLDITGEHGLISSSSDQSASVKWNNGGSVQTTATDAFLGSGKANTALIVSKQGAGTYAAKICDDLIAAGYDDWYLPSRDELNLMYKNLKKSGIGGFADYPYWSSTEEDNNNAWSLAFDSGFKSSDLKTNTYHVRAARTF